MDNQRRLWEVKSLVKMVVLMTRKTVNKEVLMIQLITKTM